VSLTGCTLTVACYVSSDLYFEVRDAVAGLLISGAHHGGTGQVTFWGYRGLLLAETLEVNHGRARLKPLRLFERQRATETEAFQALERRIAQRFDSLVGRLDGRAASDGLSPFAPSRAS